MYIFIVSSACHKYKLHVRVDIFSYNVGTDVVFIELVIILMQRRTGLA